VFIDRGANCVLRELELLVPPPKLLGEERRLKIKLIPVASDIISYAYVMVLPAC
jgi:hypothetical protein